MKHARPYVLLFLGLTVIYHSNLRPIPAGDSLPAALIPFSMVLDHSITLDRFAPWLKEHATDGQVHRLHGHWYTTYPIAGPVLVSPLYLPAALIPALRHMPPESLVAVARIAEKFTAVTLTAASAVWLLALLGRIAPHGFALALTWIFALCTPSWSISSQAMWQHTFGGVVIIGCFYFLERWEATKEPLWLWYIGAAASAALLIRPSNIFLIAALMAAVWIQGGHRRDLGRVVVPAMAALALLIPYNLLATGNVTGRYSPEELTVGDLRGWAGILVSPGRGLLVYTPIALVALAAFLPIARKKRIEHRALFTAAVLFAAGQIVLLGALPAWWGGYCWGPRYFTEALPGLFVLIALAMPAIRGWTRYAFAATALYCFFIQALGVYYYPKGHWDHLPVSVDQAPERLWDWRDNPIVRTLHGGPTWEPYVIVETACKGGLPAAAKRLRAFGISIY